MGIVRKPRVSVEYNRYYSVLYLGSVMSDKLKTANGIEEITELLEDFLEDDVATAWKAGVALERKRHAEGTSVVAYGLITPEPPETD